MPSRPWMAALVTDLVPTSDWSMYACHDICVHVSMHGGMSMSSLAHHTMVMSTQGVHAWAGARHATDAMGAANDGTK